MRNKKVIIRRDIFNLKGEVAEIVSDYITDKGQQKYILLTKDNTKVTLSEGDFVPLLKLVK